ncbi:MAG: 50S ribosomal protein L19 [Candidatus Omnitrophica bacterium]|nr:50S ribosomal protein L19 [Candidatus Omnitrophota bacterium]
MNKVELIEKEQVKKDMPAFKAGDTVKVYVRIKEEEKERLQVFEGIVLGINGGGAGKTFIVRKISYSVGVERTFPVHSPNVQKIQVVKRSKMKRSKLFYLRDRVSKKFKVEEEWGKR